MGWLDRGESTLDSKLIEEAREFEEEAKHHKDWFDAKSYLKRAKKRYSRLSSGGGERLLEHARYAASLGVELHNLENQLNYAKRIYIQENSDADLYNLARHAEELAPSFMRDTEQIHFLGYARNLFLRLDKPKDVERLIVTALHERKSFKDPVTKRFFLDFVIQTYKKMR